MRNNGFGREGPVGVYARAKTPPRELMDIPSVTLTLLSNEINVIAGTHWTTNSPRCGISCP